MNENAFDSDLEVQIHRAVVERQKSQASYPDSRAVAAMQQPLHRLIGAARVLSDLTTTCDHRPAISVAGLSFLADAMSREALRLFRLYHGHSPRSL